jgi:hypothetical protein
MKFCKKISTKTCFEKVMYVLEQRGAKISEMGKGIHCHMLVKRNLKYKPIKLIQNVKNSCKKIVGNIHNENQLNFRTVGEEYAKDKQDYITGVKTGDNKDKKQLIDKVFRKKEKIENFYGEKIFV